MPSTRVEWMLAISSCWSSATRAQPITRFSAITGIATSTMRWVSTTVRWVGGPDRMSWLTASET